MANNYRELFEQQRLVNQENEKRIQELEEKQKKIESSFRTLQVLRQELTSLNTEAQFQNEKLHSFLSTFMPDYKLINEPQFNDDLDHTKKSLLPKIEVQIVDERRVEGEKDEKVLLPLPTVSYEWSNNSRTIDNIPSYLPKLGYSTYVGNSRLYSRIKPSEELKLCLKFETISTELPAKLQLELCDEHGKVVFSKRQNIYYVKLQEKLVTLDSDKDYTLRVTSIQDDIKTDEQVVIQNKQACDGKSQVAQPVKPKVKQLICSHAEVLELPKNPLKGVTFTLEPNPVQKSQKAIEATHKGAKMLEALKPVKRPVVLFNKEPEEAKTTKPLVLEAKKVLPDVAFFRWIHGFRLDNGRYKKVSVLKVELEYPENLHDILVSRHLSLVLRTPKQDWQVNSRVTGHKCLAEFVIFDEIQKEKNCFTLQVRSNFEAADLENFALDLGPFELSQAWKRHEFAHMKQ